MQKTKFNFATLLLIGLAANGCTMTEQSRQKAEDLGKQISTYRTQQSNRVDRFNLEYRERFNQLMNELVELSDQQLELGRDADAQALADKLIDNNKSTLIGNLHTSFADAMKEQRAAIASADEAITAARAAYVKAYTDASLDLAKLDKLSKDLEVLSTKESWSTVLENASHVIELIVKTREELKQQANADTSASAVGG